MTTIPADTREVILATIRQRLLDDDLHVMRLDDDADDRHTRSIADAALDAALARGATLAEVHAAATVELTRSAPELDLADFDGAGGGIFDTSLDHLADTPLGRLSASAGDDLRDQTLNEIRRSQTASALYLLANRISTTAMRRVGEVFVARVREGGLGSDAMVVDVIDDQERVALFTAGLYGDDVESPAA